MWRKKLGRAFSLAIFCLLLISAARLLRAQDAGERAISADSFVDSVGICVHIHYGDTPYRDYPQVKKALLGLGLRHIRDGMVDTKWMPFYDRLNDLGRAGIKADFITSPKQGVDILTAFPSRVADSFEAYEAPNEFDQSKDPNWDSNLTTYLKTLHDAVKSTPSTAAFPIIGPSFTKSDSFAKLGRASNLFDYANLHNYAGGRNPGVGVGDRNVIGGIDWNLNLVAQAFSNKPIMTTEIGYRTDVDNPQGIPENVAGKYVPRVFLWQYMHDIQRTYMYELVDLGRETKLSDFAFGIVHSDFSPKPSYTALKSLLDLMSDPGAPFLPGTLSYQLTGDMSNVQHFLLQKRDGTFFLAVWLETSSYDTKSKQVTSIPGHALTIKLPTATVTHQYHYADDGSWQPALSTSPLKGGSMRLNIDDRVTILQISAAPRTSQKNFCVTAP